MTAELEAAGKSLFVNEVPEMCLARLTQVADAIRHSHGDAICQGEGVSFGWRPWSCVEGGKSEVAMGDQ